MFFQKSCEQQAQKNDLDIKELELKIEGLDLKTEELFTSLNVTPEQISAYLDNKENFTEENWAEISKQKKDYELKHERDMKQIRNPTKMKRAYASLNVQRHWLHVK